MKISENITLFCNFMAERPHRTLLAKLKNIELFTFSFQNGRDKMLKNFHFSCEIDIFLDFWPENNLQFLSFFSHFWHF